MLQISIVIFREVLEIALIIGILTAATKNVVGSSKWLISGLFLGIVGAVAIAFFTDYISGAMNDMGQEFFNGLIMLSTSIMIGWTVLWMQKHSKTLGGELRKISNEVKEGKKPPLALLVLVMLSTLREGAEVVLFLYSSYISGLEKLSLISGFAIGSVAGASVGFALYFGILKAFGKYFFSFTTILLIFFSAGITANGIGFWNDAGIVPAIISPIFDGSNFISQDSYFGIFLNIFFGYIERPTASQLIAYVINILFLFFALKIAKKV